jgi:protein arginine N-methyltransferase 1
MYSPAEYARMIADETRTGAYARALQRAVSPESVVLDIGTGTGFFALLACRFGAAHVYAVEPNNSILLARELAAANGCADRITFLQGMSTSVTLPQRADVIISDIHGVLPLHEGLIPALADARARLLAPGGRMIPRRDEVCGAFVEAADEYGALTSPWRDAYGLDLTALQEASANAWIKARLQPAQLLTPAVLLATLDYTSITSPHLSAELAGTAVRTGTLHGLALWFDSDLGDGIRVSNAPGQPPMIYGNALFPLTRPVEVQEGDVLQASITAIHAGAAYVWRWDTEVRGRTGSQKARFSQSTLLQTLPSLAELRRASGSPPA